MKSGETKGVFVIVNKFFIFLCIL